MNLHIKPRWVGDVLVVSCAGRIVAGAEAQSLHDAVRRECLQSTHIVLHAPEVQFIDSSGLGTIVRLMSAARAGGGDLKICQPPAMMRKALAMTNLHRIFEIYDTEDEAILAALEAKRMKAEPEAAASRPAILCVDSSPDVLAYLAQLLKKEGFQAITASNLVDAQVLMKARAPRLILGNSRLAAGGKAAAEIFARCCPRVPFLDLGDAFSRHDAGEAGVQLLERVRNALAKSQA
jgi:anti-sigma B factor antagonist